MRLPIIEQIIKDINMMFTFFICSSSFFTVEDISKNKVIFIFYYLFIYFVKNNYDKYTKQKVN